MTTFMRERRICSICGAESYYQETASTNSFGSPDLDLRPPEMKRSTMMTWVHQCPKCGYASGSVTDHTSVSQEWLQTTEYKKCEGIAFKSDLARLFYQAHMIKLKDGRRSEAFHDLLHAAWSSDDKHDTDNAKRCRKLALQYVEDLIHDNPENKKSILVMKADLMRRAGNFEELLQEYATIGFENDLLDQIIAFELNRAAAHDSKCYTVNDAVK